VAPFDTALRAITDCVAKGRKTGKDVLLNFEDDNILLAGDYFPEMLAALRARFPGLRFAAENGLDYTALTRDLPTKLADLGMSKFNFTVGSTHARTTRGQNRALALADYDAILEALASREVPSVSYFIGGFADDTPEKVVNTLVYLLHRPTAVGLSMFYPVPGLPGFEDSRLFEETPACLTAGSSAYPWNGSLTTAELVTLFRLTRLVNLMKTDTRSHVEDMLIQRTFRERQLYTLVRRRAAEPEVVIPPGCDGRMEQLFFSNAGQPR
jgi:hypothetical protein